jgi:hypothetical protein
MTIKLLEPTHLRAQECLITHKIDEVAEKSPQQQLKVTRQ